MKIFVQLRHLNSIKNFSESWRTKGDCSQLFLSFVKLHKPISSATLGRWIKEMLNCSGINTDIFKANSVCSASTSEAKSSGFTIKNLGARNKYFKNQYSKWARFELRPELDRVWL